MHPRHDAEGQRKQGTPSTRPGAYEGNAPANDRMQAHGASSYSFRGKAGGDKETDTRERTSRSKPCLQNQTDSRVSHTCPFAVMRTLALKHIMRQTVSTRHRNTDKNQFLYLLKLEINLSKELSVSIFVYLLVLKLSI